MGVNEDIRDAIILRGHDLARFETGQARDLVKILDKAHDSILTKIAKTNGEWTRGWLKTMLGDLKSTYGDAFGAMGSKLDDSLKQLAGIETAWSAKTLDNSIPLKVSISQPAPSQVWAAISTSPADRGHVLSELMASYQRTTVDKITGAIRQGVVEGETSAQMVSRIRGTRAGGFKNGVMQTSRNAAQALVSTAVMHVSNIARQQTYKENADILNGWQWVATLDTLTCAECGAMDGKTWAPDEDAPQPPLHFNCRCTTVPVVKSWKELGFDIEEVGPGTRASMDGQVPGSPSYESWLKSMPASVQVEALGPARAELFQQGMPVGRFMKDGRAIPLSVLDPGSGSSTAPQTPAHPKDLTELIAKLPEASSSLQAKEGLTYVGVKPVSVHYKSVKDQRGSASIGGDITLHPDIKKSLEAAARSGAIDESTGVSGPYNDAVNFRTLVHEHLHLHGKAYNGALLGRKEYRVMLESVNDMAASYLAKGYAEGLGFTWKASADPMAIRSPGYAGITQRLVDALKVAGKTDAEVRSLILEAKANVEISDYSDFFKNAVGVKFGFSFAKVLNSKGDAYWSTYQKLF